MIVDKSEMSVAKLISILNECPSDAIVSLQWNIPANIEDWYIGLDVYKSRETGSFTKVILEYSEGEAL